MPELGFDADYNSYIDEVSTEQAKFLTHYQDFLTHYNHYQQIVRSIEQTNFTTQDYLWQLYQEAKKAYSSATSSYQKAIATNQELREKIFTKSLKSNWSNFL